LCLLALVDYLYSVEITLPDFIIILGLHLLAHLLSINTEHWNLLLVAASFLVNDGFGGEVEGIR